MSSYTTFDFIESLERAQIEKDSIKAVVWAWGYSPEGYGSWAGGFVLKLKDGRWARMIGWCDTTGWGCQDGVNVDYSDKELGPLGVEHYAREDEWRDEDLKGADLYPADLNKLLESKKDGV